MMSIKNWLLLLGIYIAYLVMGMFLFNKTECPAEVENKRQTFNRDQDIYEAITTVKNNMADTPEDLAALNEILSYWVDRNIINGSSLEDVTCTRWNLQNSLFFSFTVVTTIGYGHQSPDTEHGRVWCLLYAIIGIPLNGILIGALGSVFSNELRRLKNKTWNYFGKEHVEPKRPKALIVFAEGFVFISFFSAIFIFLPAVVFHAIEDDADEMWGYVDSVYFAFITLSTIGFGDLVPDRQENRHINNELGKMTYLICIIIWIIFGMGFIFGMVEVISETLKASSKPVKKAIKGLKNQLQENEFWRRIISEIIVMKNADDDGDGINILANDGGGGSEPCLGEMEGTDNLHVRRAVSTGDLKETDNIDGAIVDPDSKYIRVPGGGPGTSISDSQLEELNEDTISSLRQFLSSADIDKPGWLENNIPGYSSMVDSISSTTPSIDNGNKRETNNYSTVGETNNFLTVRDGREINNYLTVGNGREINNYLTVCGNQGISISNSQSDFQQVRRRSLQPGKMNRKNSLLSSSNRKSVGGPIGQLLEQTTLGEFLTAVENVRKKSMAELPIVGEENNKRKSSMMRRLSHINQRKSSKEGPLPYLSHLFHIDKEDVNKSNISLISDTGTPTYPSPQLSKHNTIISADQDNNYNQHM